MDENFFDPNYGKLAVTPLTAEELAKMRDYALAPIELKQSPEKIYSEGGNLIADFSEKVYADNGRLVGYVDKMSDNSLTNLSPEQTKNEHPKDMNDLLIDGVVEGMKEASVSHEASVTRVEVPDSILEAGKEIVRSQASLEDVKQAVQATDPTQDPDFGRRQRIAVIPQPIETSARETGRFKQ